MSDANLIAADGGELLMIGPTWMRVLEDGSRNRIGEVASVLPSGVSGPPQHRRLMHDETFLITGGILRFTLGDIHWDANRSGRGAAYLRQRIQRASRVLCELSWYASQLLGAGSMKLLTGLLAATLLLAGAGTSHAEVRIARDQGGQIGRYLDRYEQLRASGQTIIIDGLCASACTIVLATIPHDKICVTPNANLAFHAAWDFGADGRTIANRGATRTLYSLYPSQVRHWIDSQGGLSPRMIFLRGRQLEAMYRPCHLSAQVAASP